MISEYNTNAKGKLLPVSKPGDHHEPPGDHTQGSGDHVQVAGDHTRTHANTVDNLEFWCCRTGSFSGD